MTDGELNRLEQEVELARTRLTTDLELLRAPETFASFKQTVVDEVRSSKDEWIEQGKSIATDRIRNVIDDLKHRAAANPLAAAAIGAGLLWHLSRRPPITSLLIGAGVFSLMRTDPRQPSSVGPWVSRARDAGEAASEKVSQWSSAARDVGEVAAEKVSQWGSAAREAGEVAAEQVSQLRSAARDAATQLTAAGTAVKENVGHWAAQSSETVGGKVSDLAVRTGELAEQTRREAHRWTEDTERRDALLFGAAAVALAAAVGMASQRRNAS
jgi:hypothetical protein